MINELNKIAKKYNVALGECIFKLWEFVSKKDLKRISKLNKELLEVKISYILQPLHVHYHFELVKTAHKLTIFSFVFPL